MKQELDSEQIFEQLDGMLRKGEQQRRAASTDPQISPALLNQSHYEEVPRIFLTEKMLASPSAVKLSFDQVVLDDQQLEDLVAQVYADVNAHIETMIPSLIDTALQQRVLEITSTPYQDPSLSH